MNEATSLWSRFALFAKKFGRQKAAMLGYFFIIPTCLLKKGYYIELILRIICRLVSLKSLTFSNSEFK